MDTQLTDNDHPTQKPFYKKPAVIITIALGVLSVLFLFTMILYRSGNPSTAPTPTPYAAPTPLPSITPYPSIAQALPAPITQLQKTVPGNPVEETVLTAMPEFLKKEVLPDNRIQYSFQSEIIARPNVVQTNGPTIVFERELTPVDPKAKGYATLSEFTRRYGQPERSIRGSKYYDWMAVTNIYASRGFALIANPNTDEVFEFHMFIPTTIDDYIQQFGQDLEPNTEPPKEPEFPY